MGYYLNKGTRGTRLGFVKRGRSVYLFRRTPTL